LSAGVIAATIMTSTVAGAQNLEVKRYNPSEWTKPFFTEIVTVNGPGKTIYLAGIGAEDEKSAVGSLPSILHLGNAYEQCRYAYDKIKRALATHGASLADAVKQVVYVTDVRYQSDVLNAELATRYAAYVLLRARATWCMGGVELRAQGCGRTAMRRRARLQWQRSPRAGDGNTSP
jgi:enamine deaminase RidA (YjgF/YER057c/UK114 family)